MNIKTYERTIAMATEPVQSVDTVETDRDDFVAVLRTHIETNFDSFKALFPLITNNETLNHVMPERPVQDVNYIAFYSGRSNTLTHGELFPLVNGLFATFKNGQTLRVEHEGTPPYRNMFYGTNVVRIQNSDDADGELLLYINNSNVESVQFYENGEFVGEGV